ncbi:MAG: hypothetical protein COX79_01095 [Candidatus Levybacteria bacterium CG_4_10_14_0_2_um_filter_36_16]|nr:MAG: hypothetical protein AUK12_03880 [Candidatus Levybacteria bacterium CG2_30_37_29]PIR79164.1 MAG: hypothetical protein COU26_02595 [Candidatus Levybacteria bacterium CG10_big_fil_rev_8_21_14_0_10_36_30]PIZ97731.1 MAG: hypothetical protein COX79_01095 [Candidatus Levybacteria bacterium CG_4_10_14_0_2_um_filter_36_16]
MNKSEREYAESNHARNRINSRFGVDETPNPKVGPNRQMYEIRLEEDFESDPRLFATRMAEEAEGFNTNQ